MYLQYRGIDIGISSETEDADSLGICFVQHDDPEFCLHLSSLDTLGLGFRV